MNSSKSLIKNKFNLIFFVFSLMLNLSSGISIAEAKANDENKSINIEYNAGYSHNPVAISENKNSEIFQSTLGADAFVTDNTKIIVEYGSGSIKCTDIISDQKIYIFSLGLDYYAKNYFTQSRINRRDSQVFESTNIDAKIGHNYKISDNFYAKPIFGIASVNTKIKTDEHSKASTQINVGPELTVGANYDITPSIKLQPEVSIKYTINMFDASQAKTSVESSVNMEINQFNFKLKANSHSNESYNLGFTFGIKI